MSDKDVTQYPTGKIQGWLERHHVSDLANAVFYWLVYGRLCHRHNMYSEKALAYPIGDFITARSLYVRLFPEYAHRFIQNEKAGGRPRQVDFALLDNAGNVLNVLETKWIKHGNDYKQDIVDDLLRLIQICNHSRTQCYFLIAGESNAVASLFSQVNKGNQSFFRYLLPKSQDCIHVEIENASACWKGRFMVSANKYRGVPDILPSHYAVWNICEIDGGENSYYVGVWQISPSVIAKTVIANTTVEDTANAAIS